MIDRVYYDYFAALENQTLSGVRATTVRLGEQLRRLEAAQLCPEMPAALAAYLDPAEPPRSLREMEGFSEAYKDWALSIGLGRDRPRFLDSAFWCIRHADEYVRATLVPRSEPVPEGFRVWLDVTFENLTEHTISGWRTGSMTVIDPAGLRRLRDFEGRRVNRMLAGEWGGGTDGPVKLPGGTRTTMIMGDGKNQPLVLSFEPELRSNGIGISVGLGNGHGCSRCAAPFMTGCPAPSLRARPSAGCWAWRSSWSLRRLAPPTISSISSTARSGRP